MVLKISSIVFLFRTAFLSANGREFLVLADFSLPARINPDSIY